MYPFHPKGLIQFLNNFRIMMARIRGVAIGSLVLLLMAGTKPRSSLSHAKVYVALELVSASQFISHC